MKRRRKSRRNSHRKHRVSHRKHAYNKRRKGSKRRSRRNKGRKSPWLAHAAKFLRAGKTLKQASASYRKRR